MSLNMDFSKALALRLDELPWEPSPNGEVERRKLERQGQESGWATTVVRFPPKSYFPAHSHPEGEEYLVLDGTFSDESGHYHKGTYVRNPPDSSHTPFSENGCMILVKLCQMKPEEKDDVVVPDLFGGDVSQKVLYEDAHEQVSIQTMTAGSQHQLEGVELFLLSGTMSLDSESYAAPAWLRLPSGSKQTVSCETDVKVWQKRREIRNPEA